MNHFKFDHDAYLQRINYDGDIRLSIDCLRDLHYRQLFTIPFENFDIVLGKGIDLEPSKLFHKLINNQRGGYCFELNGLFLMALQAFGFNVRGLLGRVHVSGTPSGKSHQFTLVSLGSEQWIADVGFGKGTMQSPIPFILNESITVYQQTFRFVEVPLYGTMLQMFNEDTWQDQYSFTLNHIFSNDISMANYYTSTSPNSHFVTSRVAALPTQQGTNTLRNYKLNGFLDGQIVQKDLEENQSYIDTLDELFGIKLEATIDDFRPVVT